MPMTEVSSVIVRKRHRKVDSKKVEKLAKSIDQTGLINPIILAGDVLVAGAHRLAAFKLLGRELVPFASMGNIEDSDVCELIEIDENLFRNELSDSERNEHMARRIEIIAKRNIPNEIVRVAGKPKNKIGGPTLVPNSVNELLTKVEDVPQLGENKPLLNSTQQKVLKTAKANALAEAKKEVAGMMGVNPKKVSEAISNHNAVTKAGLDRNKLEELNGVQYKRVADVAKKQGKEAAEIELEIQLTKKQGSNDSVIKHDFKAKLKQDIGVIQSARGCIKRAMDNLDDEEKAERYQSLVDEMEWAISDLLKLTAK